MIFGRVRKLEQKLEHVQKQMEALRERCRVIENDSYVWNWEYEDGLKVPAAEIAKLLLDKFGLTVEMKRERASFVLTSRKNKK